MDEDSLQAVIEALWDDREALLTLCDCMKLGAATADEVCVLLAHHHSDVGLTYEDLLEKLGMTDTDLNRCRIMRASDRLNALDLLISQSQIMPDHPHSQN